MNWEGIIGIFVTAMLTGIATFYLKKGNTKELKKNINGDFVLKLPKLYKYVGIFCLTILSIFIIGTCIIQEHFLLSLTIIMIFIFGGLGIPCLLAFRNYKLVFNDNSLSVFNWKGKEKNLHWIDIENIKFGPISGYIKLYGRDRVLKINHHLDGLDTFLRKIDESTKWNTKELKIPRN